MKVSSLLHHILQNKMERDKNNAIANFYSLDFFKQIGHFLNSSISPMVV